LNIFADIFIFYLLSLADCAYNQLVVEIQSGSAVSVCHFLLGWNDLSGICPN